MSQLESGIQNNKKINEDIKDAIFLLAYRIIDGFQGNEGVCKQAKQRLQLAMEMMKPLRLPNEVQTHQQN